MRIDELTGYKDNPIYKQAKQDVGDVDPENMYNDDDEEQEPFNKFFRFIEQHGFERLGHGTWSNAYEKPGYPWVFKLFKDDPAYLWYYKFCKANQNNPHVPKIKGGLIKISNDTFCVRMEKLEPWPDTPEYKQLYVMMYIALYKVESAPLVNKTHQTFRVLYSRNGEHKQRIEKRPFQHSVTPEQARKEQEAEDFLKQHYPQLLPILDAIAEHNSSFRTDLHQGNIMLRGNTPVITDPVAVDAF